jgi:hypothetical protein
MIDRGHDLPLGRQAELLGLSRSTLYYEPRPVPAAELAIMRRIDELHLDYPFAGSRMLRDLLRGEGVVIGRELVATLMRRMGIEAIYRKPNPGLTVFSEILFYVSVLWAHSRVLAPHLCRDGGMIRWRRRERLRGCWVAVQPRPPGRPFRPRRSLACAG